MAITTLTRVKALLGKTDNDSDLQMSALIEQVENDYLAIRGKPFEEGTLVTLEMTTSLTADEEITITIGNFAQIGGTSNGWEFDVNLRKDDTADIIAKRIITQIKPTSYYTMFLSSANSTTAKLYMMDRFPDVMENYSVLDLEIDTSAQITTTIQKMQTIYPDGAEMTAVQMMQFHVNAIESAGVTGESLGDYSVQYAGNVQGVMGSYPKSVVGGIKRFAVTL
jgi:hypothetical protein